MSKDTNQLMGHADDNDGIQEYDNPLPDWWLGLFWLTIVWAIGYTIHYHVIADRSQEKTLAAEVAAADERWPEQASATLAFDFSQEAAQAGESVYNQNCFACHGMQLEGGIGPSFVDEEWIHGGQAAQILGVVRNGVGDKGMPAWQGILSPEQVNQVTAYVISRHAEATGRTLDEILAPPAGDAGMETGEAADAAPGGMNAGDEAAGSGG